jgi:putative membrane protein
MSAKHRGPKAFVIDKRHAAPAIEFTAGEPSRELTVTTPAPLPRSGTMRWGMILLASLFGLVVMWAGLAATQLIEDFFARSQILGWAALAIAGLAGLAALAIAVREIWGLMRLKRIEHLQADAARAINHDDAGAAANTIAALRHLYRGRHDAAWGLTSLAEHDADVIDPRDRVHLAERYLLAPLDADAHRIVARAARRVTLLTAMTPAAALDILFVAVLNLRMLRELASLYGGRPSTLATLKLARMVVGHLAVTGGLALSDSLIQHLVGKGLVGRLSARFGEGAVNGILTSRIGLAARDVCRPVPQETAAKESLGSLLRELVTLNEGPNRNGREGQSQS